MRLAFGVVVSEVADGDGEGGASVDAAVCLLGGLESLDAAAASEPLKADDCFSRNEDMMTAATWHLLRWGAGG